MTGPTRGRSSACVPSTQAPLLLITGGGDDQLVTRIRAGDVSAFELLVVRYSGPLTAYARRALRGSHHDAEEVVQDVLVKAHHGLLRAPRRPIVLRPWIYAIARNACVDRTRRPLRTVRLADHDARLAAPGADPAERVARREALRLVVGDLQRLPVRQRDALVQSALEGRTHQQVAEALGISVGASKALVARARVRMTALRDAA